MKGLFRFGYCIATTFGKMGCIDALLQLGADVNVRDNNGNVPINFAINLGDMEIASKLAPLCQESILIQLFEHPALYCRLEKLKQFVSCAKNTNKLDDFFNMFIHNIVTNGQFEMFKILMPACKNSNIQNVYGVSTLHIAVKKYAEVFQIPEGKVSAEHLIREENNYRNIIHSLVTSGENVDCQDVCGYTPLHLAVEFGLLEIVTMLMPFYKHLNIVTKKGETPIQIAKRMKNDAMVELLDQEIINRVRCFGLK